MPGDYVNSNPFIGTFLTITTLSAGIPAMSVMLHDGRLFDFAVAFLLFFSSIMYHLSESWNTNSLFLTELQWHQMDNIGVLATIASTNVHICDFESPIVAGLMKWATFYVTLMCQLKDPWNLYFTVIPLVVFFLLPPFKYGYVYVSRLVSSSSSHHQNSSKPIFGRIIWKNFLIAVMFLAGFGGPCFVLGLDDANDPHRFFHFLWHLFGSIASYYFNISVLPRNKRERRKVEREDDVHGGSRSRDVSVASEMGY